jgi:hypothetical protein
VSNEKDLPANWLKPSATRTPLSPTAATQTLSAVAKTSEPHANSKWVLDDELSKSGDFTFDVSSSHR